MLLKKKLGEMLIEQIIEFELRRPGPSSRARTPITANFHDKTKTPKTNLRVHYLLLKYCRRQCALLPLPGPNHFQYLALKCKILNMFWT